jgi:hypothetical protein
MKGAVYAKIGKVTRSSRLIAYGLDGAVAVDASLKDLRGSWKGALSKAV